MHHVELVFKAWTDPALVAQWWGPHGFTNPVCELDVRPGGSIPITMRSRKALSILSKGVLREVVAQERLVFATSAFEAEDGTPGLEVLHTVTFTEHERQTTLTLQATVMTSTADAADALSGMKQGWNESLDRLNQLFS